MGKEFFMKKILSVFLAFCFVVTLLSGCAGGGSGDGSIIFGTWTADYGDSFTITNGTLAYDGGSGTGYSSIIVNHSDFTAPEGILYIQYTSNAWFSGGVNKFAAVYWKNLTPNSAEIALAWNTSDVNSIASTLNEAVTKFTLDNIGSWVTIWMPYMK
jgi:hypothetical protein